MSQKKFKCPMPGCGRGGRFIKVAAELVPMPAGMKTGDLQRKPPFGELMRDFIVECPEHGQIYAHRIDHHISTIPKRSKKK